MPLATVPGRIGPGVPEFLNELVAFYHWFPVKQSIHIWYIYIYISLYIWYISVIYLVYIWYHIFTVSTLSIYESGASKHGYSFIDCG